jgi:hypothetical protein
VDVDDGKVIAIAQQAIWSDADVVSHDMVGNYLEGSLPLHAVYKMMGGVGIISGLSNHILYNISEKTEKYFAPDASKEVNFKITGLTKNPPLNGSLIETEVRLESGIKELW